MQKWIELNTKIANDNMAALKQFGELNAKTIEAFTEQQKDFAEGYTTAAQDSLKKLTSVKDQNQYMELQNEIFQSTVTAALGNFKKTVEMATKSRAEYRELADATMEAMKGNFEQTATAVKEVTETAKEAIKPATKGKKA